MLVRIRSSASLNVPPGKVVKAIVFKLKLPYSLAAARGWDDAVHPEVFDQLTVMVERVSSGECCQEQTSSGGLVIPDDRLHKVRVVQRGYSLVAECKGIFQILNDFGLGFHVVRAFAVVNGVRWLLARNRRPNQIVGRGDMLQLLTKRAHTFVVAPREVQFLRRKIELVLRHRFGRFDDFLLNKTNLSIDR